jgi:hypothetical protein
MTLAWQIGAHAVASRVFGAVGSLVPTMFIEMSLHDENTCSTLVYGAVVKVLEVLHSPLVEEASAGALTELVLVTTQRALGTTWRPPAGFFLPHAQSELSRLLPLPAWQPKHARTEASPWVHMTASQDSKVVNADSTMLYELLELSALDVANQHCHALEIVDVNALQVHVLEKALPAESRDAGSIRVVVLYASSDDHGLPTLKVRLHITNVSFLHELRDEGARPD